MSYQALVFCPEEKTARTVAQVLTELDFTVEACTEPFAAVKKLMGQHFDAIVVDCDNEQNATLLFKSARNSSSNQASLAVAVVEGQAGVAKAFRIGANLVLTKPINIEQAKGTVRVARGLLRKSEPGKAGAPAPAAPIAAPAKPVAPKPVSTAGPQVAPTQISRPVANVPVPKPTTAPAWPVAAAAVPAPAAGSVPTAKGDDPLEIELEEPVTAKPSPAAPEAISHIDKLPEAQTPAKPLAIGAVTTGGAASAPAPAKIAEKPAEAAQSETASVVGSTPSFSFGAATAAESNGGNKKIFIGIAAVVVVGAAAYVGWTQLQGHSNQPAQTQAPVAAPVSKAQPVKPAAQPASSQTPVQTASAPATTPDITLTSQPATKSGEATEPSAKESATHSAAKSVKESGTKESPSEDSERADSEPAPLVVKSGKAPSSHAKVPAADATAPSLIGLAAPGASAPPPDLVSTSGNAFKPTLQTINISQGVSSGLLIKKISPMYPSNALRMHIEGSVELLATIAKDGVISHIKVLSGDAQLTKAATDAVKQWKYKPYLLNGEPVEIQTQVTINFKLPR